MPLVEIFDQFKPTRALQRNIHNGKIRLRTIDQLHGLRGIARLAANLKIRLLVYELGDSLPHHRVIVHEYHPLFESRWRCFRVHWLIALAGLGCGSSATGTEQITE